MRWRFVLRLAPSRTLACLGLLSALSFAATAQSRRDLRLPIPAPPDSVLVVGFLGGFERWNDPQRGVRKVALSLSALELPNVYVVTVENHRQRLALQALTQSAELNPFVGGSNRLRVILFGQSWGGAAVLHTARQLKASGIDVQLTVQVDSVGPGDALVPANVANAANLFQRDPLGLFGRAEIRAEDPGATRILENTQFTYLFRPYSSLSTGGSWARRTLGGSHAKMEADPIVWAHVEALIVSAINNEL